MCGAREHERVLTRYVDSVDPVTGEPIIVCILVPRHYLIGRTDKEAVEAYLQDTEEVGYQPVLPPSR